MKAAQRGMSLLVVLMLTAMASLLVFSALNNALSQERMSGNFQKKLNAELLADKAVFESYHQLNRFVRDPANANKTDAEMAAAAAVAATGVSGGRTFSTTATNLTANGLSVNAAGNRYEDSLATRRALFRKVGDAGSLQRPFGHAVTGCDGVDMSGSGAISSYDSSNPNATATNVTVQTVKKDAEVVLSGAAPIKGDVLSRGNITLSGSAVISGRVHANGNILLNNASATIEKEVWARGSIEIINTPQLLLEAKAHANITISNPATLAGGLKTKQNLTISNTPLIKPDVQVQGNINISGGASDALARFTQPDAVRYSGTTNQPTLGQKVALQDNQFTDVPLLPIDNPNEDSPDFNPICDPLGIGTAVLFMTKPPTYPVLNLTSDSSVFGLNTVEGKFLHPVTATDRHTPASTRFLGNNIRSYFFTELNMKNTTLEISGDVTIFVRDKFSLDANSKVKIMDNSTLTLITTGKVIFGSDAKLQNAHGGKPEGLVNNKPVFAIYSAFAGVSGNGSGDEAKAGIDISGAADGIYAAIYAPLTDIKISGIGSNNYFAGAALGKKVNISGAGLIRYDQALGTIGNGGVVKPVVPPRIVFNGW
jgi:Tfp pilus assembly protein PilX